MKGKKMCTKDQYNVVLLENYVTTKGIITPTQLETMQFEIGERIKAGSTQWNDVYSTLILEQIIHEEGSLKHLDMFIQQRMNDDLMCDSIERALLLETSNEHLREIGD